MIYHGGTAFFVDDVADCVGRAVAMRGALAAGEYEYAGLLLDGVEYDLRLLLAWMLEEAA